MAHGTTGRCSTATTDESESADCDGQATTDPSHQSCHLPRKSDNKYARRCKHKHAVHNQHQQSQHDAHICIATRCIHRHNRNTNREHQTYCYFAMLCKCIGALLRAAPRRSQKLTTLTRILVTRPFALLRAALVTIGTHTPLPLPLVFRNKCVARIAEGSFQCSSHCRAMKSTGGPWAVPKLPHGRSFIAGSSRADSAPRSCRFSHERAELNRILTL